MRVIVTRHGKAERDSSTGLDRDRELRPRGQLQADFLGLTLATLDLPPESLVASPFARARQTAELINRALHVEVRLDERLVCGASVSEVVEVIRDHSGASPVCLVGHNPTFDDLVGVLVDGPAAYGPGLRTGEAYVVEVDPADPIGSGLIVARIRLGDEEVLADHEV